MKPDNEYAFPHEDCIGTRVDGMTLRDYFAAKAMQGWLASFAGSDANPSPALCASLAYQMADAMLKARETSE